MLCPKCRTDLAERPAGDNTIYVCGRCEGIWMADDALRKYLRMAAAAQGAANKLLSLVETPPTATDLRCPVCPEIDLERLKYRAVEVDRCPTCRGIFLDHGEIQRIAERTLRAQQEAAELGAQRRVKVPPARQAHPVLRAFAGSGLPETVALAAIAMLAD